MAEVHFENVKRIANLAAQINGTLFSIENRINNSTDDRFVISFPIKIKSAEKLLDLLEGQLEIMEERSGTIHAFIHSPTLRDRLKFLFQRKRSPL